jgi:hypothetical protein
MPSIYNALCQRDGDTAAHVVSLNIENAGVAMLKHLPALGINGK